MTALDATAADHVDEVLATTRAVRRRLDLDRPVDNQLLLDCITEVVLFPVALTMGTDFGRAPGHPARTITYFDRFGTTFETGPVDALRFGRSTRVLLAGSGRSVLRVVGDRHGSDVGVAAHPDGQDAAEVSPHQLGLRLEGRRHRRIVLLEPFRPLIYSVRTPAGTFTAWA